MPLVVHFLNVGQSDCTVIEFPSGRVAMIDIDNLRVLDRGHQAEMLAELRESDPLQYYEATPDTWLQRPARTDIRRSISPAG